jgi:hypothetical protein
MTAGVWTTGMHRAAERFEAWREALNQSHLVWDLEPPASRHSTPVFVKSGWTVSVSSIVTATRAVGWRRRSLVRVRLSRHLV